MAKKKSKHTGSRKDSSSPEPDQKVSWKPRSSSVLWLKLNFTIKTARLQKLKRQKYQHLQEEALLKARGLLTNWEDGPVVLTEDLYSHARNENEAQELLNYTPEALALRFSIRSNPDVVDAVKQLWAVELPRDAFGCIDQLGYTALFRRIGRCLEPEADARRRRRMEKTIQEDWIRDSKGESTMGFADFFDSVFELADLWCETIEVDEYIAFLRTLVARVTTMRRHDEGRRLLRPLKQVKAIDDDNLSSSSGEISQSDLDDEEEFAGDDPNGDDSDDDDEDVPVQKEPPSPFLGLVAAKALQSLRLKTQDSNVTSDPLVKDRPRSRERRASAIMVGDLGDLEGIARNSNSETQNTPKTPNALRGDFNQHCHELQSLLK
ncbi:hypothetical protein PHYBOEH_003701 [Phytophthora boehmeriae]|uniref:Uncharacterized protein n=1 Tax=Phytophthora boehmeriae TaxID=109152 RepID=A0A8T1WQI6_9STRA|nr:hypothetical protein PHYBOEH_003701 [Phytophthora boehmeriae]